MTISRVKPAGWIPNVDTITATEANALDINATRGVDGVGGGAYTPGAALQINGSGLASDNLRDTTIGAGATLTGSSTSIITLAAGCVLEYVPGADINANNQTLDPTNGLVQRLTAPAVPWDHDLVAGGNAGRLLYVMKDSSAAGAITIRRSGFAGANIVVLAGGAWAGALLIDDGTNWRLLMSSVNTTPGTEA